MKKITLPLLALGLILVFTQCEQKKEDTRTIITKKIQYDVPIVNSDPDHDWWIRNIEGSDRDALLNNIFAKVQSGEIQAYDYFNEPLTLGQIGSILVDTMHQTLMRTTEPYTEYDTTIIQKIEPGHISLLRFLEEWKYDENTLQIDKKIYAISPVMEVIINGQKVTRPLFWVRFDEMK
ncbi:MAG: hypothetical protein ABFS05_10345 [Bacteroidota bacterium]